MHPSYHQITFLKSAASLKDAPPHILAEIAFVGRSNSGKSSVLNALAHQKIARSSKTPGRTQLLNFFAVDDQKALVDLPGYGYAKVPLAVKQRWEKQVNRYLSQRTQLKGLVLIMDIRHPMKPLDVQLIQWTKTCRLPVHILLNKADKLSRGAAHKSCHEVMAALSENKDHLSVQIFSALKKTGLEPLEDWLNQHLSTAQT